MQREKISQGPHNYLGTDAIGRPHWRANAQAKQEHSIAMPSGLPAWKVPDNARPRPQPIGKGEGLTFYSPNVEENLDFDEALNRIVSPNHARYAKFARHVADDLSLKTEIYDALGYWVTGGEDSLMTLYADGSTFRDRLYHAALLAKVGYQLSLGIFEQHDRGPDATHVIDTEIDDIDALKEKMDASGIENFTIASVPWGYRVVVMDPDVQATAKVKQLTKEIDGELHTYRGLVAFIGGPTRDKAQGVFDRIIEHYESRGRPYGEPLPPVGTFDGRNKAPKGGDDPLQSGSPERPTPLVGERSGGPTVAGGNQRVLSPSDAARVVAGSTFKEPLYHASIDAAGVLQGGLMGSGPLAATTDPQVAAEVAETLKDAIAIARGEMTLEQVEKDIEKNGGDPLESWKGTYHEGDYDPAKRDRVKRGHFPHLEGKGPPGGPPKGWEPQGPPNQDGTYEKHSRPSTPKESREVTLALYLRGRATIAAAGGRLDVMSGEKLDVEHLASLDPEQVGVVELRANVQSPDEVTSLTGGGQGQVRVDSSKCIVINPTLEATSASSTKKKAA